MTLRYVMSLAPRSIANYKLQTSNVFVANLPPHVNEQSLGMFFARMGPVGSVSISRIPARAPT